MRDTISNVKNMTALKAQTINATNTPATGIDLNGFTRCLILAAIGLMTNVGVSGGNTPRWLVSLEHSDDSNANFAAVAEADVILANGKNDGALSGAGVFATIDSSSEDEAVYTVEYIGGKRYIRVVLTAADAPGNTPVCILAQLGGPHYAPVADAG